MKREEGSPLSEIEVRTGRSPDARKIIPLLVILTLCYAVAFAGTQGALQGLQGYYQGLDKPSWTPPSWLFGPVWTVLYGLMGIAAWIVWKQVDVASRTIALTLFGIQLVLNGLWSWLFFAWQKPLLGFAEICILDLSVFLTMLLFFRIRKSAGWLLLPYLLWILFASGLNFSAWRMNPNAGKPDSQNSVVEFGQGG